MKYILAHCRLLIVMLLLAVGTLYAEPQDPPDIDDYVFPVNAAQVQQSIGLTQSYVDMAILVLALSLSSYLMLVKRSRRGLFILSLFSLAYFGFYRQGCVCPIGSIQNITQGYFNLSYAVPTVVVVYFFAPILYTLFFGRSYCASVCPHGALQDLVTIKPMEVPKWLDHALCMIGFAYLGFSVLFAATQSAYIICDYDPFVPLFRMTGSMNMLILGGAFLVVGMFVGRPYCRYFCPYGIILRVMGYISFWKVSIFKDRCIDCRLCETSCPFGCIDKTTVAETDQGRVKGRTQMMLVLLMVPVLLIGGGFLGEYFSGSISRINRQVRLADRIQLEEKVGVENLAPHEDAEAFWEMGLAPKDLYAQAQEVQKSFVRGSFWLGVYFGLIFSIKLVSLSIVPRRTDYEANKGTCFGCARCYEYCPDSPGDPRLTASEYYQGKLLEDRARTEHEESVARSQTQGEVGPAQPEDKQS